jgi:hypothetical protein
MIGEKRYKMMDAHFEHNTMDVVSYARETTFSYVNETT